MKKKIILKYPLSIILRKRKKKPYNSQIFLIDPIIEEEDIFILYKPFIYLTPVASTRCISIPLPAPITGSPSATSLPAQSSRSCQQINVRNDFSPRRNRRNVQQVGPRVNPEVGRNSSVKRRERREAGEREPRRGRRLKFRRHYPST